MRDKFGDNAAVRGGQMATMHCNASARMHYTRAHEIAMPMCVCVEMPGGDGMMRPHDL